jgi:hypothetical protein
MSEWSNLVKKLCKQHPGKPLAVILKEAKKQYKKPANKSVKAGGQQKNKSRKNKNKQ